MIYFYVNVGRTLARKKFRKYSPPEEFLVNYSVSIIFISLYIFIIKINNGIVTAVRRLQMETAGATFSTTVVTETGQHFDSL